MCAHESKYLLHFCFTATVPTSSCLSSTLINPTTCSQTVPTNSLEILFTPCTLGTVTGISPVQGPSGTSITISGTGFSTTQCESTVLLGSYECPIQSVTSSQIVCLVGANSQLSSRNLLPVQVSQTLQGSLSNAGLLQFQFQAKITSVSPTQGNPFDFLVHYFYVSFHLSRLNRRWYHCHNQWRWFCSWRYSSRYW